MALSWYVVALLCCQGAKVMKGANTNQHSFYESMNDRSTDTTSNYILAPGALVHSELPSAFPPHEETQFRDCASCGCG
uniref:Putative secreted peptide n=1 Tax=Anopheles braziliensis TaxID=58242 RepID=A0A2M3ZWD8_9DIPT